MSGETRDTNVKLSDNGRRIAFIEQCFGSAGIPLAQAGRILVAEGVLTKRSQNKSRLKQFFLFNNLLVYGAIIIPKRKFNKQRIIHLGDVQVKDIEDSSNDRNCFIIHTSNKSITVSTSTFEEKIEWMEHIHLFAENCRNLKRKSIEFLDPPVWVPDSKAALCMVCDKSEFSIVNRRHHCRNCGFVVCAACSTQRFLLPRQSSSPVRVCDPCHMRLNTSDVISTQLSNEQNSPISNGQQCSPHSISDTLRIPAAGSTSPSTEARTDVMQPAESPSIST